MLDLATSPDELVDETADSGSRRRGNALSVVVTLVLVLALAASGAWAYGALPQAHQLTPAPAEPTIPAPARNAQAAIAADRLAVAAGRNLAELAESAPGTTDSGSAAGAATVGGAQASSGKYAETLAELDKAEKAAAAQLALTEQQVADAEKKRKQAAAKLAKEEKAAAQAVDDAVAAAIAAAEAQSAAAVIPMTDPELPTSSGGSSSGAASTNTQQVHDLVVKYFPASEVGNAMAVSRCESGHANRVSGVNGNGTRDYGVFQINDGGTMQAALRRLGISYSSLDDARQKALDAATNVRMARVIWDSRGWQPWTCAAKMQVVAGLYQRAEGPMAGKYDEYGRA